MVFLALLAIAIGVLLVLSLVLVGLVEAPWPVLLVGLLAAFYGLQRELTESQKFDSLTDLEIPQRPTESATPPSHGAEFPEPSEEQVSHDDETLTYRGIRYRVSKHHETEAPQGDTLIEGTYRGQHWQRRPPTAGTANHSSDTSEVTYRGHKVIRPEQEAKANPNADA